MVIASTLTQACNPCRFGTPSSQHVGSTRSNLAPFSISACVRMLDPLNIFGGQGLSADIRDSICVLQGSEIRRERGCPLVFHIPFHTLVGLIAHSNTASIFPTLTATRTTPTVPLSTTKSVAKLAKGHQTICTWDGPLQTRAAEETNEEPIVAYPSSGAEYIYYTQRQARYLLPVFVCTR